MKPPMSRRGRGVCGARVTLVQTQKVKLPVQIDTQASLGGFTTTVLDCRQVRVSAS